MNKNELLNGYGHVPMQYMQENELYYWQSPKWLCPLITIATEFVPELATPQSSLALIEHDSGNIVGALIDNTLHVFDVAYTLPLELMKEDICS